MLYTIQQTFGRFQREMKFSVDYKDLEAIFTVTNTIKMEVNEILYSQ